MTLSLYVGSGLLKADNARGRILIDDSGGGGWYRGIGLRLLSEPGPNLGTNLGPQMARIVSVYIACNWVERSGYFCFSGGLMMPAMWPEPAKRNVFSPANSWVAV